MRYNELNEGIRYGAKQKNEVLNDLENFGFGIEIEMTPVDVSFDASTEEIVNYLVDNPGVDIPTDSIDELTKVIYNYDIPLPKLDAFPVFGLISGKPLFNVFSDALDILDDPTRLENNAKTLKSLITTTARVPATSDGIRQIVGSLIALHPLPFLTNMGIIEGIFPGIVDQLDNGDIDFSNDIEPISIKFYTIVRLSGMMFKQFPTGILGDDITDHMDEYQDWISKYASQFVKYHNDLSERMDEIDTGHDGIPEELETCSYDFLRALIEDLINDGKDLEDTLGTVFGDAYNSEILRDVVTEWVKDYIPEFDSDTMEEISPTSNYDMLVERIQDALGIRGFIGTTEDDGQIEVILEEPVHGEEIIHKFNDAFKIIDYLDRKGYGTTNKSGLHISISYKNGAMEIDPVMFAIISNTYDAVHGSAEHVRGYVSSMYSFVDDHLSEIVDHVIHRVGDLDETSIGEFLVKYTGTYLKDELFDNLLGAKFKSVNFIHYYTADGRVELRYPGGKGYQTKKDEYFDEMIRAMYSLKMSMIDPLTGKGFAEKEYYRNIYKILNKSFVRRYDMSISDLIDISVKIVRMEKLLEIDLIDGGGLLNNLVTMMSFIDEFAEPDDADYYLKFVNSRVSSINVLVSPELPKILHILLAAFRNAKK